MSVVPHKLRQRIDFSCLQAVVGTNRQIQVLQRGLEQLAHVEDVLIHYIISPARVIRNADVLVRDQHQVVNHDAGCLLDGIFGMYGTISLNLDGELLVISALSYASVLNAVCHILDGRVNGIERNDANGRIFRQVLTSGHIAASFGDGQFHFQVHKGFHAANQQVGVHHLEDICVLFQVTSPEFLLSADGKINFLRCDFFSLYELFQADLLDVQKNVQNIFHYSPNRGKLMVNSCDANCRNCKTLQV